MTVRNGSKVESIERSEALNPDLARLLKLVHLDRTWERGEGVWLFDRDGRKFLDFYSQFGALALGHNAPVVVDAVRDAIAEGRPAMVQPYRAPYAVALARELVRLAPQGLDRCVFTTSGAETVEAAIKLVRVRTGRRFIVSCEGAFHGKTMGAMAVSGRSVQQELFGPLSPYFARVPYGDSAALEEFLEKNGSDVAAVMLEPVQGEGGVHSPPAGYLPAVRELCTRHGAAMVLDEIQTGLGRTGRLFACEEEDVNPDLLLLAKALGGGFFPLGACLVSDEFWDPRFALNHSSTFANNNIACRVGLEVLKTVSKDGFCDAVRTKGDILLAGLADLAERYPGVVAEVRGRGLLTAIELRRPRHDAGMLLSYLFYQNVFAYGFAATLAELESVLVLPTLGESNVIRLAPPLIVEDEHIQKVLSGLDAILDIFARGASDKVARVVGDLSGPPKGADAAPQRGRPHVTFPRKPRTSSVEPSFAFLVHFTSREDIITTDPRIAGLPAHEFERYCRYLSGLPFGVIAESPVIRSTQGTGAKGWVIGIGLLPEDMVKRGRRWVSSEIARGVDIANDLGAKVVGLGAFTSIYSHQGMDVVGRGPAITTGNALSAVMSFRAVKRVLERRGQTLAEADVGVVGAMGSVGTICAALLARDRPRSITLVGNARSNRRPLNELGHYLEALGQRPVTVTTDLSQLHRCSVVVSATSSTRAVLDAVPFERGTIICDVARPRDAGMFLRNRSDITVIDGGLVSLPDPTVCLGAGNLQGLPPGIQLACCSETILLAMAGVSEDVCVGRKFDLDQIDRVSALADAHGFSLWEPPMDALDSYPDQPPSKLAMAGGGLRG